MAETENVSRGRQREERQEHRETKNLSVFTEFSDLTNEPSHGYNGDDTARLDYTEFTDWTAIAGIRWNL